MAELAAQLELIGARDTQHNEWRVFGPPGTGKTTHLGRQIRRAVERYGPESVLVTSFSRAAATELVDRDLPIGRERIGTLHAHCYRALNKPHIAETKVEDWNSTYPHWEIREGRQNDVDEAADERGGGSMDGDQLLAAANRWRNRMVPVHLWSDMAAQMFFKKWCEWKDENDLLDFTDLIERAAQDCRIAPGDPKVIFADEAQDFTRLQLTLVRKWGENAEYFVCVGDDDQTIYTFTGATPDAFLKPDVPADQKIILSQSYRVPQAVHALASGWISRVTHREPKEYQPTAATGIVKNVPCTWADPGKLVNGAVKEIEAGRTVMFLAACAYMLGPVRTVLMDRAIPFHNPYRLRRGDWNPLRGGNGLSAGDRVLAFARPHNTMGADARPWTAADYRRWADWLVAAAAFTHGGKTATKDLPDDALVTMDQLHRWLTPGAYDALMNGIMNGTLPEHLGWWLDRVGQAHQRTAAYPVKIATRHGLQALAERPRIILGTIHSVKGGQADTVILFPDLSAAGFAEWERGGDSYDAVVRQFYVAMTRARQKLIICAATGRYGVDL